MKNYGNLITENPKNLFNAFNAGREKTNVSLITGEIMLFKQLFTQEVIRLLYYDYVKYSLFLVLLVGLVSCAGTNCPPCNKDSGINTNNILKLNQIYIVEFQKGISKNSVLEESEIRTLKTCLKPQLVRTLDSNYKLIIVEISAKNQKEILEYWNDYYHKRIDIETYFALTSTFRSKYQNEIILKDTSEIRLISLSSDVDVPPYLTDVEIKIDCDCCTRDRDCVSQSTIFNKIELRALAGYRLNANESIFYPNNKGGETYKKKTIGFDRGGTDITFGLEGAFLWDITNTLRGIINIPDRNRFHIGPMVGVWPVDESIFIPVSLHPRYTFSYDSTNKELCECNAWYVFGDIGVPIDPTFKLPIYCKSGNCSSQFAYLYGFGIGRDWWINECTDFSIDIGFRVTNTPLPSNQYCEFCTNETDKFPFRNISQIFIRFGLTW